MPDLRKTATTVKVPEAAIVKGAAVTIVPDKFTLTHEGPTWLYVEPGSVVDLAKWPADRMHQPPRKGAPPEIAKGLGKAIMDRLIERNALVPVDQELRPDPANMRTTPESNRVFDDDGDVMTVEIKPDPAKDTTKKKRAATRRGGK